MTSTPQQELDSGFAPQCELTPEQEQAWDATMSMMAWTCPGFRHLFYRMLARTHNAGHSKHTAVMTRSTPIAATDGHNLLINPDTFFKFKLPQRVYITGHEIIHNMFGDVELLHRCASAGRVPMNDGTSKTFVNAVMQKAMDARINALLDQSNIGKRADMLDGQPCGHFDPDVSSDDSVLDVYGRYYEKEFPDGEPPPGDEFGVGNNPGGFDNLLPPGKSTGQNPQQAAQQRDQQKWAVEILQAAKAQGDMGAGLKRMFQQLLEPEVVWTDHIATLINRVVGDGGYDWSVPDPWYSVLEVYSPSPTGLGAGTVVVWGDTSGSRSDAELASNMAELSGIMADVCPQRLVVLWCDAAIDYVDEIADPSDLAHVQARGVKGGGGTSMQPVLEWIKENCNGDIDLFIGFTDGYVTFPERAPPFPVIWASSTDHVYPFGETVRVNKRARA